MKAIITIEPIMIAGQKIDKKNPEYPAIFKSFKEKNAPLILKLCSKMLIEYYKKFRIKIKTSYEVIDD